MSDNTMTVQEKTVTENVEPKAQEPSTEPRSKILFALHEVMSKVGYVQKKGTNDFHKYKYAGEGNLLEALRPAMVEAGLLLIPSASEREEIDSYGNTHVVVEYTLAHKDGEIWPEKIRAFGAGNDRNKNGVGDKGLYKALTGANKYLLFKLFQIETGDDPEEKNTQESAESLGDARIKPTCETAEDSYRIILKGYKDKDAAKRKWQSKFAELCAAAPDVEVINQIQSDNMDALDRLMKSGDYDPIQSALDEAWTRLKPQAAE